MRTRSLGTLEVAAGAVLVSFSPVFVKLTHVGPTTAGVYRMLIGGIALVAWALLRRHRLRLGLGALGLAAACGVFFAFDLIFWHRSIHDVGPGLSTILANFQVFFLAAFGVLLLGERPGRRLVLAIPVAVIGLLLLVGVRWQQLGATYHLGVVLGMLTAVSYASYLLTLRHLRASANAPSAAVTVAVLTLVTAALLIPTAVMQGESLAVPDVQSWLALVGYGIGAHAVGWALISTGIPLIPASRTGLLLLLQPALAFVWDVVLFARPTAPMEVVGAVVALGAIYLGAVPRTEGGRS